MSEIRENRLTGEWVIIAPERAKRGGNITPAATAGSDVPPFLATCPFCPGNEDPSAERFRIDGEDGRWILRTVVNKYSVLSTAGTAERSNCTPPDETSVNAVGLHEVLVENPLHNITMAQNPVEHVQRILEAYRHRFLEFYADPRVRHVIIFKNQGEEAGASQQHSHSQIVGIPIVPGQVGKRIGRARQFYLQSGNCLACTIVAEELTQGCRIIAENADFVAFIPFAALSPYHLWIFPKTHAACFSDHPGFPFLAEILHVILAKVYGMLGNPAFNLIVRSLSPQERDAAHFHWYISIVPRVNRTAGFELGTGMYINPSAPESRAQALREFVVS